MKKMNIFPMLHTERTTLRKLDFQHFPSLIKYANNPEISSNIINIPYPYQEPDAAFRLSYVVQGFKERSRFVFAIIHKEKQELIGEISLHLNPEKTKSEVGYWIGQSFWNCGYASEVVKCITTFGFEDLNLESIFGTCKKANVASCKVLINNDYERLSEKGGVVLYQRKSMT